MKNSRHGFLISAIAAAICGICGSFIYYCEKLQFFPGSVKGLYGRIGIFFIISAGVYFLLFSLTRKGFARISGREWIPILLVSLILSVCVMVWFSMPQTGVYSMHSLEIRGLPDESGEFRPVTLTWLHRESGDISLSEVRCEGDCTFDGFGPTLTSADAKLTWSGKTGRTVTVEFVSGADQGIAEIRWDDSPHLSPLNNENFSRLSFDHAFPPANGLTEFIAVWILCFGLCLTAVTAACKLFPEWNVRAFGIGAFAAFASFRICQFMTVREPLLFVDSESYLGMSQMSVSDILKGTSYCHQQFWYCIARPPFIPLVYKLCRQDLQTITVVQLTCSILCWGFFAWCAAGLCRKSLSQKAVFALVLGLGSVPNVTRWDQIIMSESLSISAALLLMGNLFWLMKPDRAGRWHTVPAICTAAAALLYANTRDSAVWIVILITVLLLCINKARFHRRVIFLLCAALAVICAGVMSGTGDRWQFPFENVLFNRIVRDPQGEAFFIEAGMPVSPRIRELYGVEHMMGSELFNSDEMAPLREWILSDGLKTYIRYMLREPMKTLGMAWSDFEKEAFEQISYTFSPKGFSALLPDTVSRFFSCNLPGILIIGLGLAGIYAAFRKADGSRYAFPVLFVLSAYLLCTGVLIADEYEFARHSMVILLMMKASAWPLIVLLLEDGGETGTGPFRQK